MADSSLGQCTPALQEKLGQTWAIRLPSCTQPRCVPALGGVPFASRETCRGAFKAGTQCSKKACTCNSLKPQLQSLMPIMGDVANASYSLTQATTALAPQTVPP